MDHPTDVLFHPVEHDAKDVATTRTLSRGLSLLAEILRAESAPTLTELSIATGLAKATVSRLLSTLVEDGFASQLPGGQTYFAGPSIARWLRTSPLESLLVEKAAPLVDELRDLTGETAVLCISAWPDRVCAVVSLSPSPVRSQKTIGESGPLTRGCTGRGFLAFATERYVEDALRAHPLEASAKNSVVDTEQFRRLLRTEREQGYTLSWEGTFPDLSGIAAPVFASASTMPVAVLNISGPSGRFTPEVMRSFAPALIERAGELTAYFTAERS
jgi:IclR family KDG regulon transcriptional repressor